ncbi:hypothetical protein HY375_02325 [Candidatus Berkelbacteria bacterium]|nr:hypothetical protein [Candidatus Berkelbacteria bacterium]
MAKRILWVSQYPLHRVQFGALRRLFGADVQICHDIRQFCSAEEIASIFRQGGYDDLVAVLPLSVVERLIQDEGVRPLWSQTEPVDPDRADWVTKGRGYRFKGFKRVGELILVLDDLGPKAQRRPDD